MSDSHELSEGEELLTSTDELIWRNVNPDWVVDGKVTSQAFRPTPKDDKKVSGAREAKVSAASHYTEFTGLGLKSAGVWAVTVNEAAKEAVPAIYDENSAKAPTPCPKGHTSLDFTSHSNANTKRIGARLRDHAELRKRQHP